MESLPILKTPFNLNFLFLRSVYHQSPFNIDVDNRNKKTTVPSLPDYNLRNSDITSNTSTTPPVNTPAETPENKEEEKEEKEQGKEQEEAPAEVVTGPSQETKTQSRIGRKKSFWFLV